MAGLSDDSKLFASVEDYLAQLDDWRQMETVALAALDGEIPSEFEAEQSAQFKIGLLQWAVSSTPRALLQWDVLGERSSALEDRSQFVGQLWSAFRSSPRHRDVQRLLEARGAERAYTERLFRWFLQRLEFRKALQLWTPRRRGALVVPLWSAALVAVALLAFHGSAVPQATSLALCVALPALALLIRGLSRVPGPLFTEALLPRLAATVGMGYLFLATAPKLVGLLISWDKGPWLHWLAVAGLLTATWLYIRQHISARVRPRPRSRRRNAGALAVLGLAAGYSAVGAALAAPVLFSPDFLGLPDMPRPEPHQWALCAGVALALGVALELAWEERALAEPL